MNLNLTEERKEDIRWLYPALGLFLTMFRDPYQAILLGIYALVTIPLLFITNVITSYKIKLVLAILYVFLLAWSFVWLTSNYRMDPSVSERLLESIRLEKTQE